MATDMKIELMKHVKDSLDCRFNNNCFGTEPRKNPVSNPKFSLKQISLPEQGVGLGLGQWIAKLGDLEIGTRGTRDV